MHGNGEDPLPAMRNIQEGRKKVRKLQRRKKPWRRSEREEEMTRKKLFLERWKEKEERKRRQKAAEEGWKNLINSISEWEEMTLDESDEEETTEMEIMTEEGFREAGMVIEDILEEVMAFAELDEKFGGTVLTNDIQHQYLSQNQVLYSQAQAYESDKENKNDFVRNEIPETEGMELLGETVPPILHSPQGGPPDR